jgi:hypothetical protein
MRMINDRDRAIQRSVSDAAASCSISRLRSAPVSLLPRQGVALPTRVKLKQLPAQISRRRAGSALRDQMAGVNDEFSAPS